jgi:hypothetical protein
MKRQIVYCDRCNAELGEYTGSPVMFVDRTSDGAGKMQNCYVYGDLCQKCLVMLVKRIRKELNPKNTGQLAKLYKGFVKNDKSRGQ